MVSPAMFTVDRHADHNSDGTSRYGNYLALHRHLFRDEDAPTTDPAEFAAMAWRVANSPIMAPSYVQTPARVHGTDTHCDEQNHRAVVVRLALPRPVWVRRPMWQGWSWDRLGSWFDPGDNSRITALAALTMRVPIPAERVPIPFYDGGAPDVATAKRAVDVLLGILNHELGDVLAVIESGRAGR